MSKDISIVILKGNQDKIINILKDAFATENQTKTITINKEEKKRIYNHKKKLTSVQKKLLSIYVSENDNFTWSQLFNIFNTTNIARPSNRLVHHFLKQNDYIKIKTIHNQKIKYLWKKK